MIFVRGSDNDKKRQRMIDDQLVSRGVKDRRVLDAMRSVPRECFVRKENRNLAYYDGPLSIGHGQTISQPYIVAYMTELLDLKEHDRVLEIGTGCGYQTAVLAGIAREVYTIEIIRTLSEQAREKLRTLGCGNVRFRVGDGTEGWPEAAPFDAIIVTAAPGREPETLISQLAEGGRLVVPVGTFEQYLYRIVRTGEDTASEKLIAVRFVPMTGEIEKGNA